MKQRTFDLAEPQLDRLALESARRGLSVPELIRRFVDQGLDTSGTPWPTAQAPAEHRQASGDKAVGPLSENPPTPPTASISMPPFKPPVAEATGDAVGLFGELDPFEAWWSRYPAKGRTSKKTAKAKWAIHVTRPGVPFADVLAGEDRWLASQRWADGYVVAAERWITQRRWQEYPPVAASRGHPAAERGEELLDRRRAEEDLFRRRRAGEITEEQLEAELEKLNGRDRK